MNVLVLSSSRTQPLHLSPFATIGDLRTHLPRHHRLFANSRLQQDDSVRLVDLQQAEIAGAAAEEEETCLVIRVQEHGLLGGKGGFGALLRGQNAKPGQKRIVDDMSACRDLSGRRVRHANNEKALQEWKAKAAERELEKLVEKQKRAEQVVTVRMADVEMGTAHMEDTAAAVETGIKEAAKAQLQEKAKREQERRQAARKVNMMSALSDSEPSDNEEEEEAAQPDSRRAAKSQRTKSPERKESAAAAIDTVVAASKAATEAAQTAVSAASAAVEKVAEIVAAKPELLVEPIHLDQYSSVEELEKCGGERLKAALMARGLKCGGPPAERAARLFSVKGKKPSEIDPKLKASGGGGGKK